MEREEDSLLIGERRAQVRSEFQEQDSSSLTRWNKHRKKVGPPDKLKTCPMCAMQCQLQTRNGKSAICETQSTAVWRCSTCSDGRHKRGIFLCEECLGHGAPVKGDVEMETEGSPGASVLTVGAQWVRTDVNEADLRRCNRCAEPFVATRVRRLDQGQLLRRVCPLIRQHTNKSLMDLQVHDLPATPRHEHFLRLLSNMDALPLLQTIQWIPRGLDRRYAAVRLQALDRAMQAAKANTAAPIQRLWSKMALITHLIL